MRPGSSVRPAPTIRVVPASSRLPGSCVVTDVIRDGKPVVGYGFNSNGRYGQG